MALFILLWAFGLWTTRLTDPFTGRHDNINAWQTISARNYLRYGYLSLGFLHAYDVDPLKIKPEIFYNSTAPLPAVLVSLGIILFGDYESSTRIVPMCMTLIGGSALFTLVRVGFGRGIGLLTLLLFMTTPMIAFYGQMVAPEEFFLAFFLLTLLAYQHYLKKPTSTTLALIIGFTVLTTLSGWVSVFAVAAVCLHALFFAPKRFRLIAMMVSTLVITNLSWMLLGSTVMPDFWGLLFQRFAARTGGADSADVDYNGFFDYLIRLWWTRMRIRFTEALCILALIGGAALWLSRHTLSPRQRQTAYLTGVILIPAILYLVIFQEATWVHDYFTYTFSAPLAVLAALGLVALYKQYRQHASWQKYAVGLILAGLLLGLFLSTLRWTRALYLEQETFPVLIAPHITAFVPAGSPLYSNIPYWPAVWYYSQRDVITMGELVNEASSEAYLMTCERNARTIPAAAVTAGSWSCLFEQRTMP